MVQGMESEEGSQHGSCLSRMSLLFGLLLLWVFLFILY